MRELLALPPDQKAGVDIARMNLLCSEGLPGAEEVDVDHCLQTLDRLAHDAVLATEDRWLYYVENADEFWHSQSIWRMLSLVLFLQHATRVHYCEDERNYRKNAD